MAKTQGRRDVVGERALAQRAVMRALRTASADRSARKTAATGRFLTKTMTGRVKSGSAEGMLVQPQRRMSPTHRAVPAVEPSTKGLREMSVSDARERMSDVVSAAQYTDAVTYLTRHGKRVAAIVSAENAEWLEQVLAAEDAEDREALAEYRAEQAARQQTVSFSAVRDALLAAGDLDDDEPGDVNAGGGTR